MLSVKFIQEKTTKEHYNIDLTNYYFLFNFYYKKQSTKRQRKKMHSFLKKIDYYKFFLKKILKFFVTMPRSVYYSNKITLLYIKAN